WRQEYNAERPHSSLGYLTPNRFADSFLTPDSISYSY
ncbi:MAG: transposase, partial [Nitrosospira sp.]|nr:transposase [Nitrosospira sp.]MBA2659757.1 transposase [Nitrosospira sp.]